MSRLMAAMAVLVLISCLSDPGSQRSGITDGLTDAGAAGGSVNSGGGDSTAGGFVTAGGGHSTAGGFVTSGGGNSTAGGFVAGGGSVVSTAGGAGGGGSVAMAGGVASSGGGNASVCGMRAAGGADFRRGSEFITSASMSGSFGGVMGAETRCNIAARGAGLARIYRAWVTADARWPGDAFFSPGDDGPDVFLSPRCPPEGFSCASPADERGVPVTDATWTGFSTPCVAAPNCSGWTSGSAAEQGMTDQGLASCQERHRLLCRNFTSAFPVLAIDAGPPQRTSFVTRQRFTGALGGIAGADAHCQNVARDGGLAGGYAAFLGTSTLAAPSRFVDGGSWGAVRATEVTFLNDATLWTTPRRPLSEDETGAALPADEPIWTGSGPWATSTGDDCMGWTVTSTVGTRGSTGRFDETWVEFGLQACAQTAHLLCLEN